MAIPSSNRNAIQNQITVNSASYANSAGSALTAISASVATTASYALTSAGTVTNAVSASYAATASLLLGSVVSASYALTASYAMNGGGGGTIDTSSFATTGSNRFNGNQIITGSLDTTNYIRINTNSSTDSIAGTDWLKINADGTIFGFSDNAPSGQGFMSVTNGTVTGFGAHVNNTDGMVFGSFNSYPLTLRTGNTNRVIIGTDGISSHLYGLKTNTINNLNSGQQITIDPDGDNFMYIKLDGFDDGGERMSISNQYGSSAGIYIYTEGGNSFRFYQNQFKFPDDTWQTTAYPGNIFVQNDQTSSFVQNSATSSFVQNSQTSSFVQNSQTSSFVVNSQTSSFVQNNQTSSMLAPYVLNSSTSSFIANSQTSSMSVLSASYSYTTDHLNPVLAVASTTLYPILATDVGGNKIPYIDGDFSYLPSTNQLTVGGITSSLFGTSSWAINSLTSSYVLNAISSSFASTASLAPNYVLNSDTSSFVTNSQTSSMTVSSSLTSSFLTPGTYIITASQALTSSYSTQIRAGSINQSQWGTGSAPAGTTPFTASVSFTPPFPNTSYSVAFTAINDVRFFGLINLSRSTTGFRVSTNSVQPMSGSVTWIAILNT